MSYQTNIKRFTIPKVSFVIRTKNEAVWLPVVLRSLSKQTFQNFELIFVDSGSSDGTLEIIRQYQHKLIEIPPEDFHYSYALNLGKREAAGEYICIISGHSLPIGRKWLELGLEVLKESDRNVGVTGNYFCLPDAPVLERVRDYLRRRNPFSPKRLESQIWMSNTNSLIRKSAWELYNFDETLLECEDHDWAWNMVNRGYNLLKIKDFDVLHSHYHIPGSKNWKQRAKEWDKINQKISKRYAGKSMSGPKS